MKHNINELYKIIGQRGTYSKEAIEKANLTIKSYIDKPTYGDAKRISYMVHGNKPIRIYTNINRTEWNLGYFYGEHVWFDSQEELDNHRKQISIEAKENHLIKLKEEFEKTRANYEEAEIIYQIKIIAEN